MNGLVALLYRTALAAGKGSLELHCKEGLELPGFFRATKEWDFLAMRGSKLVALAETKGFATSFGNNLNNRTEEAVGSGYDIRRAIASKAIGVADRFWLGYLLLIADVPESRESVRLAEPHFKSDPAFTGKSYMDRALELCRRLRSENLYGSTCILAVDPENPGDYRELDRELGVFPFLESLRQVCLSHESQQTF